MSLPSSRWDNFHPTVYQLFLAKALDPPKVEAMDKAWNVLGDLGAIDSEGELTALGRQMVCYQYLWLDDAHVYCHCEGPLASRSASWQGMSSASMCRPQICSTRYCR